MNALPQPPQPRQMARANKTTDGGSHDLDEGPKPGLPPRRPTTDLLGDDEEMSLGGWETLKPN